MCFERLRPCFLITNERSRPGIVFDLSAVVSGPMAAGLLGFTKWATTPLGSAAFTRRSTASP
mgnify:CR=1 FL=1